MVQNGFDGHLIGDELRADLGPVSVVNSNSEQLVEIAHCDLAEHHLPVALLIRIVQRLALAAVYSVELLHAVFILQSQITAIAAFLRGIAQINSCNRRFVQVNVDDLGDNELINRLHGAVLEEVRDCCAGSEVENEYPVRRNVAEIDLRGLVVADYQRADAVRLVERYCQVNIRKAFFIRRK